VVFNGCTLYGGYTFIQAFGGMAYNFETFLVSQAQKLKKLWLSLNKSAHCPFSLPNHFLMALQLQVQLLPPRFAHTRLRGPVNVSSRTIEVLDPCSECQGARLNDPFPSVSARSKTLLNSFRAGSTCDSFKDFDGKVCFYDIMAKKPVLLPASRDPVLAQEACVAKCRDVLALHIRALQEVTFVTMSQ
jgi:hypothetical protein